MDEISFVVIFGVRRRSLLQARLPNAIPALLEACEVKKIYHMGSTEVAALNGVSVAVSEGEFVALQGTSGSGKSTLLNLFGGLDTPSAGEIVYEGKSLAPLSKREMARYRRRAVGMIFQNFNLIPTMTAAEQVELALAFGKVRGRERAERARELLGRVGLAGRVEHRPSELSGGEQQRVAIARALANGPALVLLDEPTGDLDTATGREILGLLQKLNKEEKVTLLVATHDAAVAAISSRVVKLRDGKIESDAANPA